MITLAILVAIFFSSFVCGSPITPRAGAPTFEPVPSTCHFTNAVPQSNLSSFANETCGYKPKLSFAGPHIIYSGYFDLPTPASELWTQCTQRCYSQGHGHDERGDCKSAILAYDVPVPEDDHDGAGGELRTACFLFSKYTGPDSWETAAEGQWLHMRAGNLYCEA